MPEMPESVRACQAEADVWRRLCESYDFRPCDVDNLALLCHWHAVADRLCEQMTRDGKKMVIGRDDEGNTSVNPAFYPLQAARGEIAALERMLGIAAGARPKRAAAEVTKLEVIQGRRREKVRRASSDV